eukprot:CAMPEP_0194298402 /NCGR_PEP_ID=MMETSP0169-20130528/60144_1 /TAXON_ID=218684 /ORGANISM="Corethron pennatum, Strain L29A3" /LENGTH=322 /DNA_ID=CAMNT_0039048379 /DNA_START=27 /DNA_END=997 /DNA_ORIENTATION=+
MASMFRDAYSFNGDVTEWDTSSVTDMSDMFSNARAVEGNSIVHASLFKSAFNVDISGWDVSAAESVRRMFYNARSFSAVLEWCLREGADAADMFYESPGSLTRRCPPTSPSVIEEPPIEEPPLIETAPDTERAQAPYDRATFLISVAASFTLCVVALVLPIKYRVNRRTERDDAEKDDSTVCSEVPPHTVVNVVFVARSFICSFGVKKRGFGVVSTGGADAADMFYESPGSLTRRCPPTSPSVIEEPPIEEPPLIETAPDTERAQAPYDRATFLISVAASFTLCVVALVLPIKYRVNRRTERDDAEKDDSTVCSEVPPHTVV